MRDRIDNTCHGQKIMARVQEEHKSYDEDELFNGDPFADECLDLDIYSIVVYHCFSMVKQIIKKYFKVHLFHSSRITISLYSVK